MRVLLIDNPKTSQLDAITVLRNPELAVDAVCDSEVALWATRVHEYDVIVLSLQRNPRNALALLAGLRGSACMTAVLALGARYDSDECIRALRGGADDYASQTCESNELLARLEALARRRHGTRPAKICLGELLLDTGSRTLKRGGHPIDIAPREYAVLEYLALRPDKVVSRQEIEAHVYEERTNPMSNVVDAAIYALRKRIDAPGRPSLIQTRRRMGYVLHAPNLKAGNA